MCEVTSQTDFATRHSQLHQPTEVTSAIKTLILTQLRSSVCSHLKAKAVLKRLNAAGEHGGAEPHISLSECQMGGFPRGKGQTCKVESSRSGSRQGNINHG